MFLSWITWILSTPWLQAFPDGILLAIRVVLGGTMLYYGWGKIRNPKANAKDFEENIMRPGWFFGSLVMVIEFFGGLAVLVGLAAPLAAAAIAFEMFVGTLTKAFKWKQGFGDWSYDVLILALCLVVLTFGVGAYAIVPYWQIVVQ